MSHWGRKPSPRLVLVTVLVLVVIAADTAPFIAYVRRIFPLLLHDLMSFSIIASQHGWIESARNKHVRGCLHVTASHALFSIVASQHRCIESARNKQVRRCRHVTASYALAIWLPLCPPPAPPNPLSPSTHFPRSSGAVEFLTVEELNVLTGGILLLAVQRYS
jgi:hypothetical protein